MASTVTTAAIAVAATTTRCLTISASPTSLLERSDRPARLKRNQDFQKHPEYAALGKYRDIKGDAQKWEIRWTRK